MRESLVLNFEVLENRNISVAEFLFLYWLSQDKLKYIDIIDFDKLQRQKLIKIITGKNKEKTYILREKAIELIEFLTIEVSDSLESSKKTVIKSQRAINKDINGKIDLFRDKWKGLKAGSMGSSKSCKNKLIRWMKENPDYSFEQILEAADMYIDSLRGDYRFLQRADYFIFKQENNREESSRLSAFVDEIGADNTQEWTSTLK